MTLLLVTVASSNTPRRINYFLRLISLVTLFFTVDPANHSACDRTCRCACPGITTSKARNTGTSHCTNTRAAQRILILPAHIRARDSTRYRYYY
jgi:hypothetical protein